MMLRVLSVALVTAMLFTVAGCKKKEPVETTPTTVATTTTEAPNLADETILAFDPAAAVDVTDEAILAKVADNFADKEFAVQTVKTTKGKSKLSGIPSENLLAVYVKDRKGNLKAVEATMEKGTDAEGNEVEVEVYEVGEKAEVYLAYLFKGVNGFSFEGAADAVDGAKLTANALHRCGIYKSAHANAVVRIVAFFLGAYRKGNAALAQKDAVYLICFNGIVRNANGKALLGGKLAKLTHKILCRAVAIGNYVNFLCLSKIGIKAHLSAHTE
jgi:predicted small lipoprotein YifL